MPCFVQRVLAGCVVVRRDGEDRETGEAMLVESVGALASMEIGMRRGDGGLWMQH